MYLHKHKYCLLKCQLGYVQMISIGNTDHLNTLNR